MKNKKHSCNVFIIIGVLLLIAAVGLAAFNLVDQFRAGQSAQEVLEQLHAELPKEAAAVDAGNADLREASAELDELEIPDYVLNPNMEMPTMEIDGQLYIGTLTVPVIDLELPVLSAWSYPNLKISPCRYTGSVYQSNMVIAAHNYSTHFGNLKDLSAGDEVVFTDISGNVFHYQVAEIEVLQPSATEEMTSGDWSLTLFTCTVGGQNRVTVRCTMMEQRAILSMK